VKQRARNELPLGDQLRGELVRDGTRLWTQMVGRVTRSWFGRRLEGSLPMAVAVAFQHAQSVRLRPRSSAAHPVNLALRPRSTGKAR
jgi:hypothetical protein